MSLIFNIGARRLVKQTEKNDAKRVKFPMNTDKYSTKENIPYTNKNVSHQQLDIYYSNKKNAKTIINIHGGAWIYGDQKLNNALYVYWASHNYNVVSIAYRLMPKVDLRDQILDCYSAIKFILQNGKNLNLNTDEIMLSGDSAGAHLALLSYGLLTTPKLSELYGVETIENNIKMITLYHPMVEVHNIFKSLNNKHYKLFDSCCEKSFFKKQKSKIIIHHSSLSEIIDDVTYPFIYIVSSEADGLNYQSKICNELLTKKKQDFIFHMVEFNPNYDHVFEVIDPSLNKAIEVNEAVLNQFEKLCHNKNN